MLNLIKLIYVFRWLDSIARKQKRKIWKKKIGRIELHLAWVACNCVIAIPKQVYLKFLRLTKKEENLIWTTEFGAYPVHRHHSHTMPAIRRIGPSNTIYSSVSFKQKSVERIQRTHFLQHVLIRLASICEELTWADCRMWDKWLHKICWNILSTRRNVGALADALLVLMMIYFCKNSRHWTLHRAINTHTIRRKKKLMSFRMESEWDGASEKISAYTHIDQIVIVCTIP